MRNILVTGATGFLGSRILNRLIIRSDLEVIRLLVRPTTDLTALKNFDRRVEYLILGIDNIELEFSRCRFDTVLHCATDYGRSHDPGETLATINIDLPRRLMNFGLRHGLRRFINIDTLLPHAVSPYSQSKGIWRNELVTLADRLSILNLRFTQFYGPGDSLEKFIPRTILQLIKRESFIPLTSGLQRRDFLYIDDAVDAFDIALSFFECIDMGWFEFEVGSGISLEMRQVLLLLQRLVGDDSTTLGFGALEDRENEPSDLRANIEPLWKLGWRGKVRIQDGLMNTIEYIRREVV